MRFNFSKYLLLSLMLLSLYFYAYADENNSDEPKILNDGPYILYAGDSLEIKWISKNKVKETTIPAKKTKYLERKFNIYLDTEYAKNPIDYKQEFKTDKNIVVLGDTHGQYDITIELLKNHNIIDEDYHWNFGKGHLVVLGDIFDRGDKVTELLWLVYNLEQQAKKAGGKVHLLMGNHELMIFHGDLRYIDVKYSATSLLFFTNYSDLFLENSVLGNWLRSKPMIIKINDLLFTHAGISTDLINLNYSQEKINRLFIDSIYSNSLLNIMQDSTLYLLWGSKGPAWYRDYFKKDFNENDLDIALDYFKASKLIVGHTSLPNISLFYNNKLIGADSGIKNGKYGELLIIKNNTYYRGTLNGGLIKIL